MHRREFPVEEFAGASEALDRALQIGAWPCSWRRGLFAFVGTVGDRLGLVHIQLRLTRQGRGGRFRNQNAPWDLAMKIRRGLIPDLS